MRRLDSYFFGEMLRYFLMILLVVAVIFFVVDYLSNASKFFKANLSLIRSATFVFLRLQEVMIQIFPLALLLSILITFSMANRSNELIAVQGGGIGPWVLLKSISLMAGLVCILGLFFVEVLAPASMVKVHAIQYEEIYQRPIAALRKENIWLRKDSFFIHVDHVDVKAARLVKIRILEVDEKFFPKVRIIADSARFISGGWLLENVTVQGADPETEIFTGKKHLERFFPVDIELVDFERSQKMGKEMGIRDLWRYIRKIRQEGYDVSEYRVDLFGKTAFPFAGFPLCLIAAGIALKITTRKKNIALNMAKGLGAAFLYWVSYNFSISLGYGNVLPAIFAAWMPNILFTAIGAYMILGLE